MEYLIKETLDNLSDQQYNNVKAHAELADEQGPDHPSHTAITNWINKIAKAGGYSMVGGAAVKLIKTIINHTR